MRARAWNLRHIGLCLLVLLAAPTQGLAADTDPWFGPDKALHFGASAALVPAGYGLGALVFEDRSLRLASGAALSLSAGVAKELWDLSGRGTPSLRDMTWNVAGMTTGLLLTYLADRYLWPPGKQESVRSMSRPVSPAVFPALVFSGGRDSAPATGPSIRLAPLTVRPATTPWKHERLQVYSAGSTRPGGPPCMPR